MWTMTVEQMSRKLDQEHRALMLKGRRGLSMKDEKEFLSDDVASRWLRDHDPLERDRHVAAPAHQRKQSRRRR